MSFYNCLPIRDLPAIILYQMTSYQTDQSMTYIKEAGSSDRSYDQVFSYNLLLSKDKIHVFYLLTYLLTCACSYILNI